MDEPSMRYDVYFIGRSKTVIKRTMPHKMMVVMVPALRAKGFNVFAMIRVSRKTSAQNNLGE